MEPVPKANFKKAPKRLHSVNSAPRQRPRTIVEIPRRHFASDADIVVSSIWHGREASSAVRETQRKKLLNHARRRACMRHDNRQAPRQRLGTQRKDA